jgi:hypothetical protein
MPVYGLCDPQWYLQAIYFFFLTLVLFAGPGFCLLSLLPFPSRLTKLLLSPVIGLVFFTLFIWLSGILHLYWLIFPYFFFSFLITFSLVYRRRRQLIRLKIIPFLRSHWLLGLLIIFGLLLQLPAVFTSGLRTADGLRIYFVNNGDGLMHLGFINALAQQFPPLRPEINLPLTNYHYFSDLLQAQFVRLGITPLNLFFQFFPLWLSVLTTTLVYQLTKTITRSSSAAHWTTLVWLMASDGGFWLSLIFSHSRGWQMATFDNGADTFLNIPYAFSKLIVLAIWYLLNHFWQTQNKKTLTFLGVMTATLTMFKVYWAMFILVGWGLVLLWQFGRELLTKKTLRSLITSFALPLLVLLATALGSYALLSASSQFDKDTLAWVPNVWPHIIVSADHLNWSRLALEKQFIAENPSFKRLAYIVLRMIVVSLIFVYGARLFALFAGKKTWQLLGSHNLIFFFSAIVIWTIMGFNTMQGVGRHNSFNFLILSAIALLIPLGVNLSVWWQGHWWTKALVIIVIIALSPRTLHNSLHYLQKWQTNEENHFYPQDQLELLLALRQRANFTDLVAVNPDNQWHRQGNVIGGLAGRQTYVSNQDILGTHNLDFAARDEILRQIFNDKTISEGEFQRYLREEVQVKYLYLEARDWEEKKFLRDFTWQGAEIVIKNESGIVIAL